MYMFTVCVLTSHAAYGRDRRERVGAVVEGVGYQRGRLAARAHGVGDAEEPLLPARGRVQGGVSRRNLTLHARRNAGGACNKLAGRAAPRGRTVERGGLLGCVTGVRCWGVPAGGACRRSTADG